VGIAHQRKNGYKEQWWVALTLQNMASLHIGVFLSASEILVRFGDLERAAIPLLYIVF
jgi:hypothetical protein